MRPALFARTMRRAGKTDLEARTGVKQCLGWVSSQMGAPRPPDTVLLEMRAMPVLMVGLVSSLDAPDPPPPSRLPQGAFSGGYRQEEMPGVVEQRDESVLHVEGFRGIVDRIDDDGVNAEILR
jgi:hypothetical protein